MDDVCSLVILTVVWSDDGTVFALDIDSRLGRDKVRELLLKAVEKIDSDSVENKRP